MDGHGVYKMDMGTGDKRIFIANMLAVPGGTGVDIILRPFLQNLWLLFKSLLRTIKHD